MALTPPRFTYTIPVPGARPQAVYRADRPDMALMAAIAAVLRGEPLMGLARGLTPAQAIDAMAAWLVTKGVPSERLLLWARGANLERLGDCPSFREPIGGLTLDAYQREAAAHMTVAGGGFAMSVGLGKTLTTLAAVREYLRRGTPPEVMVVCPLNAIGVWKRQIPHLEAMGVPATNIRIESVDSAHKLVGRNRRVGGILIVDEAHMLGEMNARRTKAMLDVRLSFDQCLSLTGTLVHGGVERTLALVDLTVPGGAGFATRWSAGEHFQCLNRKKLGQRTVTGLMRPAGEHRDRYLEWLGRYWIAMTRHSPSVQSCVSIPEQYLHTVEFGAADEDVTDAIVRVARGIFEATGEMPHASMVMHEVMREGVAQKIDYLLAEMDGNDEPVVVFAEYHETLDAAEKALAVAGVSYIRVDGSVTGDARTEAVRRFQAGEVRVFLGQIDAAGVSVELTRACVSVALDLTLRANNYAQALGRVCRRGQTHECHHFDYLGNALQRLAVNRLRAAEDFNAEFVAFTRHIKENGYGN